jgi:hypothetical protein
MLKFLKNHCEFKEGEEVATHENADYLLTLKVVEKLGDEKGKDTSDTKGEEVATQKEKVNTPPITTKKVGKSKGEKVQKNSNGTNK